MNLTLNRRLILTVTRSILVVSTLVLPQVAGATADSAEVIEVEGPKEPIRIHLDRNGIPFIEAQNELDAKFAQGYIEAKQRFWEMDLNRRVGEGSAAELLGPAALADDGLVRTLGLDRVVTESIDLMNEKERALFQAYSDGVNAYILDPGNPLPVEYERLELTRASIRPWQVEDILRVVNLFILGLSLDTTDIDASLTLQGYTGALGQAKGGALFFGDLFRYEPLDPQNTATSPDLIDDVLAGKAGPATYRAMALAADKLRVLGEKVRNLRGARASNWVVFSGHQTRSRQPVLINDSHHPLSAPSIWYEVGVDVKDEYRVTGMTSPGLGGLVVTGDNGHIAWGSTNSTTDLTDIYFEVFGSPTPEGIPRVIFEGNPVPLDVRQVTLNTNIPDDGAPDTIVPATTIDILTVSHHGPIIHDLGNGTALSIRLATGEGDLTARGFMGLQTAKTVQEGMESAGLIRIPAQNYAFMDKRGNIGYLTTAPVPLREDMELGIITPGMTPDFVRDGTHTLPHEWLPNPGTDDPRSFAVVPIEEMPQEVNPSRGFLANSNNDQLGLTVDGDPFNSFRQSGSIYYLGTRFGEGRISRLLPLIDQKLAESHGRLSLRDIRAIQNDQTLRIGEILTPHIVEALNNAQSSGSHPVIQQLLTNNPQIAEAVGILRRWDFSTPTGIPEGYDIGDNPWNLPSPDAAEIDNSVATTIFHMWSDAMCDNVVLATLDANSVPNSGFCSGTVTAKFFKNILEDFPESQGVGLSGLDFFQQGVPASLTNAEDRRDYLLLKSIQDALSRLASAEFEDPFAQSTNLLDYRWGRVHRLTVPHQFDPVSNVPPMGPVDDLAPNLPGASFGGSTDTVNVAPSGLFNVSSPDSLRSRFGVSYRRLATFEGYGYRNRITSFTILPTGQSGDPDSLYYANQLPEFLVGKLKKVPATGAEVRINMRRRLFLLPKPNREMDTKGHHHERDY